MLALQKNLIFDKTNNFSSAIYPGYTAEMAKNRIQLIRESRWLQPDVAGFLLLALGLVGYIPGPIPHLGGLTVFFMDIRAELIGIGLTVLIIDNIVELRSSKTLKDQLIREMSSSNNSFALRAVEELRAHGWLTEGTLQGANLKLADLTGASLDDKTRFPDGELWHAGVDLSQFTD